MKKLLKPLSETQSAFLEYLRAPLNSVPPQKLTDRRQAIYRDLVFKNIDYFLSSSFPISKSLLANSIWELMLRDFLGEHKSATPYFLEIAGEFLAYVSQKKNPVLKNQPYWIELAHYEWIQRIVFTANIDLPPSQRSITNSRLWRASPLVMALTYNYPVHLFDETYTSSKIIALTTHLLVYRNRDDQVITLETSPIGLRIIQLLQTHLMLNCIQLHSHLCKEASDLNLISVDGVQAILHELSLEDITLCEM